ncbi:flagellar export chaperone FliS [Colwellia sp. E2M01]|uniref:flagellar export chaperone FliS n=1 Tax=Colwellia sp. E2M01 TaxID=2841561 RepID=UPI001C088633|nr:flagellar export chaperone FliS [Colwellia sp. E2M01]MBU2869975.1 flagellar export chaperone FliS [Colwellia sp. E2M01]
MRANIKKYQNINVESGINAGDPHTIISMLFDGIFQSISVAKGAIERKDFATKSIQLNKSMSILRSLQDSLDMESEPQISKNFYELYAYCIDRLTDVSVSLDLSKLDDVVTLLKPLADAWKEISAADKDAGLALLKAKKVAS